MNLTYEELLTALTKEGITAEEVKSLIRDNKKRQASIASFQLMTSEMIVSIITDLKRSAWYLTTYPTERQRVHG